MSKTVLAIHPLTSGSILRINFAIQTYFSNKVISASLLCQAHGMHLGTLFAYGKMTFRL